MALGTLLAEGGLFWYRMRMTLEFNTRGNGACPLCALHRGECRVQRQLLKNADFPAAASDAEMEIVIYTCPFFVEKA